MRFHEVCLCYIQKTLQNTLEGCLAAFMPVASEIAGASCEGFLVESR